MHCSHAVMQSSMRCYICQHIKSTQFSLSICTHVCPFRIRGNGEVIKREDFDQRKAAAEAARLARLQRKPQKLVSQGKNLEGYPLLQVSVHEFCMRYPPMPCMICCQRPFKCGAGMICKHCCIKPHGVYCQSPFPQVARSDIRETYRQG